MENKVIKPAERLTLVQEYYFSRKLKEVAQMNSRGLDIISLAIGSPDMPPSQQTIDTLCHEAQNPDGHGYQPTIGIPELRQAMSRFYKRFYHVDLDPTSEIQPLIGSKEGILHTTLALVNPGEAVLVPNPGYPTYTSLSKLLGAEIINYNLREDNGWQPDFDQLEAIMQQAQTSGKHIRLLWVNYPNMPTGGRAMRSTYERLVDFGLRHGIVIINDNPYSFILNQDEKLSILQIPRAKECSIEFNSMSKSHNMPGWRVGMLASNKDFVQWILKVKSNIDSGTFRALQLAAAQAYDNSDEWHTQYNISHYRRRRQYAEQIMDHLRCTYDKSQTGMFLWGRIPDTYTDCEQLTEQVLHQARVFITPGFIFGSVGRRYIRISLCAKDEKMQEAVERIRKMVV